MKIKYCQIHKLKNTNTPTPNPLKGAIVLSIIVVPKSLEVSKSPLEDLGVYTIALSKSPLGDLGVFTGGVLTDLGVLTGFMSDGFRGKLDLK